MMRFAPSRSACFSVQGAQAGRCAQGTLGALIPWPGATIAGLLLSAANWWRSRGSTLYFISTEGVFYSPDFGAHWRQTLDLPAQLEARQLLGFERGEEDSPTANASGSANPCRDLYRR